MNIANFNWKSYLAKIQRQSYAVIGLLSFALLSIGAGGVWFYLDKKEAAEESERLKKQQELAAKIKKVNDYYKDILDGASPGKVVDIIVAVSQSSLPVKLAGFSLDSYKCDLSTCAFSFLSQDGKIFNIQDLYFHGDYYKPNISPKGVEYQIKSSPLKSDDLHKRFEARESIDTVNCSELINYVRSFNSLMTDKKFQLNLSGYPASSIESIENVIPEVKNKYALKSVKWNAILDDDILAVTAFLKRQAYSESFRINKIEKKKSSGIEISGNLICTI
ncbi:pilus assembly protein [Escherichia coli]|nr:pilus assembly protein [Escherichia coli]HAW0131734.1 pilus assembly protein [Escherichia coli]